jgi:hypothetical protein
MIIENIQYWLWTGVGLQQSMIISSHYSCITTAPLGPAVVTSCSNLERPREDCVGSIPTLSTVPTPSPRAGTVLILRVLSKLLLVHGVLQHNAEGVCHNHPLVGGHTPSTTHIHTHTHTHTNLRTHAHHRTVVATTHQKHGP